MTNSKQKIDAIHKATADRLLSEMEKNGTDWLKPWSVELSDIARNPITGTEYSGSNVWTLMFAKMDHGFTRNEYLTFPQIKKAGNGDWSIKGQKSCAQIVRWISSYNVDKKTGDKVFGKGMFPKIFNVWNVDQIEGYPAAKPKEKKQPLTNGEAVALSQNAFAANGAKVVYGGNVACFIPSRDQINMPNVEDFATGEAFASTGMHELTHWTGHSSRLDRDLKNRFGSKEYAFEELVAEFGACFTCAAMGIEKQAIANHAKYLNSWKRCLATDPNAINKAITLAGKASKNILSNLDQTALDKAA